jgi:hypothetical protein
MSDENRIRRRAHEIWEEAGSPHGLDQEHWEQARREIEQSDNSTVPSAVNSDSQKVSDAIRSDLA